MATRESCLRIETIAEVYERRVAEHARERRARGKRQSLAFLHVKRGEPASEAEVRRQSLAIGGGFEVRASEGRALVDGRRHFEPCAVRRSLTRRRTRRLTWVRKGLRLPRVHAASEVVAQFSRLAENATSGSKARRSRTIERPTRTSCARLLLGEDVLRMNHGSWVCAVKRAATRIAFGASARKAALRRHHRENDVFASSRIERLSRCSYLLVDCRS